uniref:Uncharacterized protein n=1 Tax=Arundo donax TaxID=35708 RepID=A0A0A9C0N7_ARUDO
MLTCQLFLVFRLNSDIPPLPFIIITKDQKNIIQTRGMFLVICLTPNLMFIALELFYWNSSLGRQ